MNPTRTPADAANSLIDAVAERLHQQADSLPERISDEELDLIVAVLIGSVIATRIHRPLDLLDPEDRELYYKVGTAARQRFIDAAS